ncbi:hypothetical protein RUND412_007215 [Rhizina undulata]
MPPGLATQCRNAAEHSAKIMDLKLIIELSIEAGDQVLVFSHYIDTLNVLERFMKEWGVEYRRLDGKAQTTGGLGLNLPGANRVVILDFGWTPMSEEQAGGRAYRIGYFSRTSCRVGRRSEGPVRKSTKSLKEYLKPPTEPPQEDLTLYMGKLKDLQGLDKIIEK